MNKALRCYDCYYSVTHEFSDPIGDAMLSMISEDVKKGFNFPKKYTMTKCHIQGPPQIVDPEKDWCYQWKQKEQ